jgi:hypothetical protein
MRRVNVLSLCAVGVAACNLPYPADVGPDARADAAPDARPSITVSVNVIDISGRGPATGTPVVFSDPAGALVAMVQTDSAGHAQADLPLGGSATAIFARSASEYDIYAVLGVKPGDNMTIRPAFDTTSAGTFTVSFPPYAGATSYTVFGPCGMGAPTTTTSTTLTMYEFCVQDPMTVSVDAMTTSGVEAHLENGGVAYSDGGSVTLNGSWQGLMTLNETLTNIPSSVAQIQGYRYSPDRAGHDLALGSGPPANGVLSLSADVPTSAGAIVWNNLKRVGGLDEEQQIYQQTSGGAVTYALDVGSHMLPWLNSSGLDLSTNVVTTSVTGTNDSDIAFVNLAFSRSTTTYAWYVAAPDPAHVVLPGVPDSIAPVNPRVGDQIAYVRTVLFDADSIDGYDAARADPFNLFSIATSFSRWPTSATMMRTTASP